MSVAEDNWRSPQSQVEFLTSIQSLLEGGSFSSTYKLALLHALADLSLQRAPDDGSGVEFALRDISRQVIARYWAHVKPLASLELGDHRHVVIEDVLLQNAGQPSAVVKALVEARNRHRTLPALKRDADAYHQLVTLVARRINDMPLTRLQRVGSTVNEFLYSTEEIGASIRLRPGVADHLRKFYGLVTGLVRAKWTAAIRKYNRLRLPHGTDLESFLFGVQRKALGDLVPVLEDVQGGRCLYCDAAIRKPVVDHFIPWSRYPVDLGHNFVLTHAKCNASKSADLASERHLDAWLDRNDRSADALAQSFDETGFEHDVGGSLRIANWAYDNAAGIEALVWDGPGRKMTNLRGDWQSLLAARAR